MFTSGIYLQQLQHNVTF